MKGVRILVDDVPMLHRFGVCTALAKPHRRAWWMLIASFPDQPAAERAFEKLDPRFSKAAERAFEKLDPRFGRAWVDLDHDDIQPIDLHGAPLALAEANDRST